MSLIPTNGEQEHSVVALRLRNDRWTALRGVLSEGGLRVEETCSFDLPQEDANDSEQFDDPTKAQGQLAQWLDTCGNPPVYVLLPAGLTISRVLELSPEDDQDLEQSLRLQAESHLLGGSSAHRIGMAPLPTRNPSVHQGIVITWPESSRFQTPQLPEEPFCVSETAALLGMLPEEPLESPLLHAERATGSLALILEYDGQLLVRSTREQDSDDADWRKAITHAVIETAVTDQQPTEAVERLRDEVQSAINDRDELLMLPESVREHLQACVEGDGDEEWWQEWGLSVGALLATRGHFQMLTMLSPRKPIETGGTFGEITRALSRPQTVAAILVAAFFAIALLPLVAAWFRLAIVEKKIDDHARLEQILKTSEQQQAIYNEIAQRSWPMTKLLGDVANCMPLGIDADQITINEGDAIIVRGAAGSYDNKTPRELLEEMAYRLDHALIFSGWKYKDEPINSGGKIEFSINLSLARPFSHVRNPVDDFGEKSHGERRYAEAYAKLKELNAAGVTSDEVDAYVREDVVIARAEEEPPSRMTLPRSSNPRSSTLSSADTPESTIPPGVGRENLLGVRGGGVTNRRSSSGSSSRGSTISGSTAGAVRRSDSSGAVSSGGPAPVPEEFTDTELAALSMPEAKELLERVAKAKLRKDLDEETSNRLRSDLYRVLDHMKSIPEAGESE